MSSICYIFHYKQRHFNFYKNKFFNNREAPKNEFFFRKIFERKLNELQLGMYIILTLRQQLNASLQGHTQSIKIRISLENFISTILAIIQAITA